jgi:hypothetical protein
MDHRKEKAQSGQLSFAFMDEENPDGIEDTFEPNLQHAHAYIPPEAASTCQICGTTGYPIGARLVCPECHVIIADCC